MPSSSTKISIKLSGLDNLAFFVATTNIFSGSFIHEDFDKNEFKS